MKNLIFALLASTILAATAASAQHTTPRFGTTSSSDQTYRGQKLQYKAITDATLQDTFTVNPASLSTIVKVTLTDTVILYASVADAYVGDQLDFIINNSAGANHIVRFTGRAGVASPFEVGSGTLTMAPTASKNCTIRFLFNGAKWVELARVVQ